MPRNRKVFTAFRLDPEVLEEVRRYAGPRNVTRAVEAGLAWWLKQARRKAASEAKPRPRQEDAA